MDWMISATIWCWECRMHIPARRWTYDKEQDCYICPICGGREG